MSEDLSKETECEGGSVLTHSCVCDCFGDLPQLVQGAAVLALPLPMGGQVLWGQPGVCGAAELRAVAGDGLTKDVLWERRECTVPGNTCHPRALLQLAVQSHCGH